MKKFLVIALLSLVTQAAFAIDESGTDSSISGDGYSSPPVLNPRNLWFQCGGVDGKFAEVTNDFVLILTDVRGQSQRLQMKPARNGMFSKSYVTRDGKYILKASIRGPRIQNANGKTLAFCSAVPQATDNANPGVPPGSEAGNFP